MLRLGQMQNRNFTAGAHASVSKTFCAVKCRETVSYASKLLGANGILFDKAQDLLATGVFRRD